MRLSVQKRLASQVLGVSETKVWFDSTRLDEIKEAITKQDIRSLVKDKAITKKDMQGPSMGRIRKIKIQKSKGRRKGSGSHKGKATARLGRKENWINHIRVQRDLLQTLREKDLISPSQYRSLYLKSKGGFFRSRRHLKMYMQEHKILEK